MAKIPFVPLKVGEFHAVEADTSIEALQRAHDATRGVARYRDSKGRQHFCHGNDFRAAYVRSLLKTRAELRARKVKP